MLLHLPTHLQRKLNEPLKYDDYCFLTHCTNGIILFHAAFRFEGRNEEIY